MWRAVTYPLNECGESLGFVLRLSFGFIPPSHLSDGLLEELGELQFSCQTLLLFLLLQEMNKDIYFKQVFIQENSMVNRN